MGSYANGVKEPLPDDIQPVAFAPNHDTTVEAGFSMRTVRSFVICSGCILTLMSSAELWVGY
jgi:hypothetical protein